MNFDYMAAGPVRFAGIAAVAPGYSPASRAEIRNVIASARKIANARFLF
jgi:hypothetical protein